MINKKAVLTSVLAMTIVLSIGCTSINTPIEAGNNDNPKQVEENNEEEEKIMESHNQEKEEPIDQVGLRIEEMTLDEKIGQLVLVGMDGYDVNDNIKELIQSYHVGGIILYRKNVKDSNQLLSLINSLKSSNSSNKAPLFISVDEEGGSVSRNPNEVKKLPTARSIGKTKDSSLAFEAGRLLGQTVKKFGYNMNFAPVLDIDSNPLNPVIGNRSFGGTIEVVSTMGFEMFKGINEEGVIPVIKHFPGHGDTSVDSHIGLPVVDHDLKRIMDFEIVPFKHTIDNGADVVMVSHILMSQIDPEYPASMSSMVINDILRDKLKFEGVVITDDMTMGAIEKNYNIGDAAVRSIKAGTDIILVGHNYEKAVTVFNAIKAGIDIGVISIDRIDESVYKILKLKEKYGLEDSVIEDLNVEEINRDIGKLIEKVK
ncbi:beta-N-acetylhexosaminidase [Alkaliphilus sp. B6464]|uniref:beta-N-acetylhexosaminidase n=1 Tax=Alkaliphilus sp. B6464 TaxID=2731219 RepID=UPI001BA85C53|nr:beta-N-acetylhexosaminidase [Alkaliphilus sp. B6464]QUH18887.1 beta-N-acetylhexosaminidase [Alkaliphilus sp. B6464]